MTRPPPRREMAQPTRMLAPFGNRRPANSHSARRFHAAPAPPPDESGGQQPFSDGALLAWLRIHARAMLLSIVVAR
jgi:hypothetical protein